MDPLAVDAAGLAAASGAGRVVRGGSFWDLARYARSAFRLLRNPRDVIWYLGFRVLLPVAPRS